MNRLSTLAVIALLAAGPVYAQTSVETAEEILNESADTPSEEIDPTPIAGEEDCDNPTAEVVNDSADTPSEEIGCVETVDSEPVAGEEIFEELEEADDSD